MGYQVIREEDFNTYKLYQFVGDDENDLNTIKTDYGNNLTVGSTAYIKEDDIFYKYMVDISKNFIKMNND